MCARSVASVCDVAQCLTMYIVWSSSCSCYTNLTLTWHCLVGVIVEQLCSCEHTVFSSESTSPIAAASVHANFTAALFVYDTLTGATSTITITTTTTAIIINVLCCSHVIHSVLITLTGEYIITNTIS